MLRMILAAGAAIAVAFGFVYLLVAFVVWNLDAAEWPDVARVTMVVVGFLLGAPAAASTCALIAETSSCDG